MGRLLALLGALVLAIVATRTLAPLPSPDYAGDSLRMPLPPWVVLPSGGRLMTSGTYPPQPPYGVAAVATYEIDGPADDFVADYRGKLDAAGYGLRQIPVQPNLIIDAPDRQFEADERDGGLAGGRVIYVTLRSGFGRRFVQLTFWDAPAPRLP